MATEKLQSHYAGERDRLCTDESQDFDHYSYHRRPNGLFWAWLVVSNILSIIVTAILLRHLPLLTQISRNDSGRHNCPISSMNALLFQNRLRFSLIQRDSDAWNNSIYTGKPSHESDTRWKKIQVIRDMAITQSTAAALALPSTGLSAQDDKVAVMLGVQHNIHCIRFFRQLVYPEYYYPEDYGPEQYNSTLFAEHRAARAAHAGHCLESLRQSVMCTPDLVPRRLKWRSDDDHAAGWEPCNGATGSKCTRL